MASLNCYMQIWENHFRRQPQGCRRQSSPLSEMSVYKVFLKTKINKRCPLLVVETQPSALVICLRI